MTTRHDIESLADTLSSGDSQGRRRALEKLTAILRDEKSGHVPHTRDSDTIVVFRAYVSPLLAAAIRSEGDQGLLFNMLVLAEMIGPTGTADMPLALVEKLKASYQEGKPIWADIARTISIMGKLPWIGVALDETKGMDLLSRRAIVTTLVGGEVDPEFSLSHFHQYQEQDRLENAEGVLWVLSQSTRPDDADLLIELNVFFARAVGAEKVKRALLECDKRTHGRRREEIEYDLREIGYRKLPLIGWVYAGAGRTGITRDK